MLTKKVIAVVGATGQQGGSVVKAILNDGEFTARAIVRDVNGKIAEELRKQGAETVFGNVDDVNVLTKAIEGSYGMFCVSFPNHNFDPVDEQKQIEVMAEAANRAGIKHVVWSTLEDTRKLIPLDDPRMPTIHGKYKVPHYDCKAEADKYFTDRGVPTSFLLTTAYWDNMLNTRFGFCPRKGPDGKLFISLPIGQGRLLGIAVDDIGKVALALLKRPDLHIGKRVGLGGEALTLKEMAEKLSKALGREIGAYSMPYDDFRKLPFPGAVELGNMFQYYIECEQEFIKSRDPQEIRKINPEQLNFDQFLAKYAHQIPIPE